MERWFEVTVLLMLFWSLCAIGVFPFEYAFGVSIFSVILYVMDGIDYFREEKRIRIRGIMG